MYVLCSVHVVDGDDELRWKEMVEKCFSGAEVACVQ